jgi:hypothetical protein
MLCVKYSGFVVSDLPSRYDATSQALIYSFSSGPSSAPFTLDIVEPNDTHHGHLTPLCPCFCTAYPVFARPRLLCECATTLTTPKEAGDDDSQVTDTVHIFYPLEMCT